MIYNLYRSRTDVLEKRKVVWIMKLKYAVALMKGGNESILGIFNTREEADRFGEINRMPKDAGLHYCFAAPFSKGRPVGRNIKVYSYYNV